MRYLILIYTFLLVFNSNSFAKKKANLAERLSQTGLYENIATKSIRRENLFFEPQYPLWSDGAQKLRWIYLPPKTQIDVSDPDHWRFPKGTKIWKEFRFGRRVETRYMEKLSNGKWLLGTYLWDSLESDATLASANGVPNYVPIHSTASHDIPSLRNCNSCHRRGGDPVLGFDAIQLSDDRDPLAIHGQPLSGNTITLRDLIERKLLLHFPESWKESAPTIHASSKAGRAAMGYLHGNCGGCHNPDGVSGFTGLHLRHLSTAKMEFEERAFATAVDKKTSMFFIPDQPESFRILSGNTEASALHYRMSVRDGDQMPPIATKLVDEAALRLIRDWIRELGGR